MNEQLERLVAALRNLNTRADLLEGVRCVESLARPSEPRSETRRVLEGDRDEMAARRLIALRLVGYVADAARLIAGTTAWELLAGRAVRYEQLTAPGSGLDVVRRSIRRHLADRVRRTRPPGCPVWEGYDAQLWTGPRHDLDGLDWDDVGLHLEVLRFARHFSDMSVLRLELLPATAALALYRQCFHSEPDHDDHADWVAVGEFAERLRGPAELAFGDHLHGCWLIALCSGLGSEADRSDLATRLARRLECHRNSVGAAVAYLSTVAVPSRATAPEVVRRRARPGRGRPRSPAAAERDVVIRGEAARCPLLSRSELRLVLETGYPEFAFTPDLLTKACGRGRNSPR